MLVRLLLASILLTFYGRFSLAAENIACPDSITTRQELTSAPSGWSPLLDDTPHNLAGITFYDGPPADKASLVYDKYQHGKVEDVATWTFGKQEDRRIYLVCNYAGTAVQLSRTLPPQVTSCSVSYDPQLHIAGLEAVKKINCR